MFSIAIFGLLMGLDRLAKNRVKVKKIIGKYNNDK